MTTFQAPRAGERMLPVEEAQQRVLDEIRAIGTENVAFTEVDVESAPEKRAEMQQKSGRRTVPQIFIGDTHVGGSDDLHDLDAAGKLDALLGR